MSRNGSRNGALATHRHPVSASTSPPSQQQQHQSDTDDVGSVPETPEIRNSDSKTQALSENDSKEVQTSITCQHCNNVFQANQSTEARNHFSKYFQKATLGKRKQLTSLIAAFHLRQCGKCSGVYTVNSNNQIRAHNCHSSSPRRAVTGAPGPALSTFPNGFPVHYPCIIATSDGSTTRVTDSGYGASITMHLSKQAKTTVFTKQSPHAGTVNEAEYLGLITSIEALNGIVAQAQGKFKHVYICTDSSTVVNQVNGKHAVNAPNLASLHRRAREGFRQLKKDHPQLSFTVKYISRIFNNEADRLARAGRTSKETAVELKPTHVAKFVRKAIANEQKQRFQAALAERSRQRMQQQNNQSSQHSQNSQHSQQQHPQPPPSQQEQRKRRAQMEREKRKAARAHLDQRVPNNPVPPSDPKYDPLYHVATTNTWVEIPDVAKQQFTNIMRELLAQFSNIPLEQRCSSRATDVISKIQLLPSEVLAKSSSRMNAKAVRKLKRGMFAFARNASSEEKIELEARREREAVAAAGVAAIACALREVPDEKHGDEPALEIAMHSPTQAAFSPGSPPTGSQARAPQLFVADSVADEGSVSDAHAEEAGEHAKVDVPAAASGSDASAEEEECESEADAEAVERAVRSLAFRIVRAQQLYLRGYTRKATNLLLSTPPIILNPQVIQKLFDLHPEPSSRDRPPIPEDAPNVAVDPDLLVKIVRRAANGSSRDASGWTAELLVVLLDDEECMAGLTDLIQDILNNNLNEDSRQLILLSKLIALQKANDPSSRLGVSFTRSLPSTRSS